MSETIQKSWITDENGQKIAPKTLIEQVQDNDGTPLQNYVDKMILTDEEDSTAIPEVSNDISNDIVQFTSEDNDGSELYTDFSLSSGSKLSVLIQKATRIVNNVKYMIKLLGNTDISSIGDGTVTGGISTLNESLKSVTILRMYGNIVDGVCDIKINGITDNSVAIVCCNQGNSIYVISTYCTSGNLKITVNNNQANGITEFVGIIKF